MTVTAEQYGSLKSKMMRKQTRTVINLFRNSGKNDPSTRQVSIE